MWIRKCCFKCPVVEKVFGHQEQAWCRCRDPELLARPPRCCVGAPVLPAAVAGSAFATADAADKAEGAGADPNEAPNDGNSEEEGCGSHLTMIGEQPPEVSDVGLAGAATNDSIDSSERTEATSSSDPADESDEDGGMSSAELTRCAG